MSSQLREETKAQYNGVNVSRRTHPRRLEQTKVGTVDNHILYFVNTKLIDMIGYVLSGFFGAVIVFFIFGGWYLLDDWIDKISLHRWEKRNNIK